MVVVVQNGHQPETEEKNNQLRNLHTDTLPQAAALLPNIFFFFHERGRQMFGQYSLRLLSLKRYRDGRDAFHSDSDSD